MPAAKFEPTITLKPRDLQTMLKKCITANQPLCIWSHPGLGKTSMTKQATDDINYKLFYYSAPSREPTDIVMQMQLDPVKQQPVFLPPPWKTYQDHSVLFIDEANRGTMMFQNALLPVVYNVTGERPERCSVVLACNYEGLGVQKMNEALRGRAIHVNLVSDANDWLKWGNSNGIKAEVLAYIMNNPHMLHVMNPDDQADCTPRTWEFVSNILDPAMPPEIERAFINGAVGQKACIEFWGFLDMFRKLAGHFDINALRLDPDNYKLPDNVSLTYAVANSLSMTTTPTNIGRTIRYLNRLPLEYNVFAIRSATRARNNTEAEQERARALQSTPEFVAWCVEHQEVM